MTASRLISANADRPHYVVSRPIDHRAVHWAGRWLWSPGHNCWSTLKAFGYATPIVDRSMRLPI